jgi:hypothetical protein
MQKIIMLLSILLTLAAVDAHEYGHRTYYEHGGAYDRFLPVFSEVLDVVSAPPAPASRGAASGRAPTTASRVGGSGTNQRTGSFGAGSA